MSWPGLFAAGPASLVSHRTALQLWGVEGIDERAPIEITTVLERDPRIAGLWVHRSGLLDSRDERVHCGIPVTTVERAINELSGRLTVAALGRLTDDAVRLRLTTFGRIVACFERLRQAPGRSPNTMSDMLATRLEEFGLRESWLEEFVFESLQRHNIPLPETQVWIELPSGPRRLDKCYAAAKLVLESDGFDPHSSRRAFDDDRARNNELLLAGYRVLHFTSEFTDYDVARTVAAALELFEPQRAPEGPLRFKQWCEARRAVLCSARGSGARRER